VSAYLCDFTGTGINCTIEIKPHKRNALITKEMNGFLSLNELVEREMRVGNPLHLSLVCSVRNIFSFHLLDRREDDSSSLSLSYQSAFLAICIA
jgi:hypothetical protein